MNLILLTEHDFTDQGRAHVRLMGRRLEHILGILKPSLGDELTVGLLGSKIGKGRVTAINDDAIEMDVSFFREPPAPGGVRLVLALPRPVVFKRILSHTASLGVKHITLVHSARVEKSYWKSPALKDDSIRDHLILGLEQAQDTILPKVTVRKDFRAFVRDELPGIISGAPAFVGHVGSDAALPCDIAGRSTLVVGPEGGFVPHEVKMLEEAGCKPVSFGARILRVETAVIAALARLGL